MSDLRPTQPESTMTGSAPDMVRLEDRTGRRFQTFRLLSVVGLGITLALAVLAFGAVQSWAILGLQAGAVALLLLWAIQQLFDEHLRVIHNALFGPMAAFALLVAAQIAGGWSAYPFATYTEFMKMVAYGILFFVTVQCMRDRKDCKRFLGVVVVFAFFLAVFAIVQDLTWNGKIYWVQVLRHGGNPYGPYVNRNHYAGAMEMLASFPLVLAASRFVAPWLRMLIAFVTALTAASIFLCGSRGGMIAFSLQALLLGAWLLRRRRRAWPFLAVLLLVAALVAWLGADKFVDRLETLRNPLGDNGSGIRPQIVRDGLRMFAERPVLGWGLGVFPIAYGRYRSFYSNLYVNEAHNDYLQLLVETGVLGFAAMVFFIVLLYRVALGQLWRARESLPYATKLASLLGCTGILVHSFSDFNLHIPANAALFYVLAAIATSPGLATDQ